MPDIPGNTSTTSVITGTGAFTSADGEELLPGWQIRIARHGEVAHFSSYGKRDVEAELPIADDTIFRLYSMTKPITCLGAMMLIDEGRLAHAVRVERKQMLGKIDETADFTELGE